MLNAEILNVEWILNIECWMLRDGCQFVGTTGPIGIKWSFGMNLGFQRARWVPERPDFGSGLWLIFNWSKFTFRGPNRSRAHKNNALASLEWRLTVYNDTLERHSGPESENYATPFVTWKWGPFEKNNMFWSILKNDDSTKARRHRCDW